MRRARGFSLAEAVVASLLVAVVLLASAAVFTAIGRRTDSESARLPSVGGMTDVALDRLERDLVDAERLPATFGPFERGRRVLILEMPSGGTVVWHQEGARLFRSATDDDHVLRDRAIVDRMLLVEFAERTERMLDVRLRRRQEPPRLRTVLLRNAGGLAP